MNKLAKTVSRAGSRVYRYFFNNGAADLSSGGEMRFLLGEPLRTLGRSGAGGAETELSHRIIRFWTNFAKFGDPNGQEDGEKVWPEFTAPSWPHLSLSDEDMEVGEDMRGRVCVFWDQILPSLAPFRNRTRVTRRRDGTEGSETGCREVKQRAHHYFPGYRPVHRL